jgi:hypothetical protein
MHTDADDLYSAVVSGPTEVTGAISLGDRLVVNNASTRPPEAQFGHQHRRVSAASAALALSSSCAAPGLRSRAPRSPRLAYCSGSLIQHRRMGSWVAGFGVTSDGASVVGYLT